MDHAFYDVPVITLTGENANLRDYEGQVSLVVNVASKCGFTPQYEALEKLHRRYHGQGFSVLAFPCNQFGAQEPGSAEEIASFCSTKYDVTFPMFAKVEVNGQGAHPLFSYLRGAAPGLLGSTRIKWNFTKFLVGRSGHVHRRYGPATKPLAISSDIEALLP